MPDVRTAPVPFERPPAAVEPRRLARNSSPPSGFIAPSFACQLSFDVANGILRRPRDRDIPPFHGLRSIARL